MNYIKEVLMLIKEIVEKNNIVYDSLYQLSKGLKNKEFEINIDENLRARIETFIYALEVEKINDNMALLLGYNLDELEENTKFSLSDLSDELLVQYFGIIIYTVSLNEKDNLVLLKYNECIWNTGWHNLAKQCRGKVIDKNTYEIVSYPFDKFFNLNENVDSNLDKIERNIKKANYISVTDKKDGSTIIVSKYDNGLLITTNGSFDNEYIEAAKKIFDEKYSDFINNVPEGYTFIFELIHPNYRIVLDYGDEKDLYLLAIRDLSNYRLLTYNELLEYNKKFGLNVVEQEPFNSLDDLIERASSLKNANKEGWVIRVVSDETDMMFKLKLEEYFIFHKMRSSLSIKKVYNHYLENTIDPLLENADPKTKDDINFFMEDINICLNKALVIVKEKANEILNKFEISLEEFGEDREKMIEIINYSFKDRLWGPFIVRYLKHKTDDVFNKVLTKKFLMIYETINNLQ